MRRVALLALVIAGLAGAGHLLGLTRLTTLAGMRALVDSYGAWGPAAFVAVSAGGVLFHLPELVFVALGGALFGPARGLAYGWTASVLGASASFLLARYVLQDVVQRGLAGRALWLARLDERLPPRLLDRARAACAPVHGAAAQLGARRHARALRPLPRGERPRRAPGHRARCLFGRPRRAGRAARAGEPGAGARGGVGAGGRRAPRTAARPHPALELRPALGGDEHAAVFDEDGHDATPAGELQQLRDRLRCGGEVDLAHRHPARRELRALRVA